MITARQIKRFLRYDPNTGYFLWIRKKGNRLAGTPTGKRVAAGRYVHIGFGGKIYQAHRLAWLYMTGEWPSKALDHINGDCSDNRWNNLRLASNLENKANSKKNKNNTSGLKGVSWVPHCQKWKAQLQTRGVKIYLGIFLSRKKAHQAYLAEARKQFGEFARAS